MKLSPSESRLLDLIRSVGGSYCPGSEAVVSRDIRRLLARLERRGLVLIEQTDDGFRYSLTGVSYG